MSTCCASDIAVYDFYQSQNGGRQPSWIFLFFLIWLRHTCQHVILLLHSKFRFNRTIWRWDNFEKKTIFKMASVRHLGFGNFDCSSRHHFYINFYVNIPNFVKIEWFAAEISKTNHFRDVGRPPYLIFEISYSGHVTRVIMSFCFLYPNVALIGQYSAKI